MKKPGITPTIGQTTMMTRRDSQQQKFNYLSNALKKDTMSTSTLVLNFIRICIVPSYDGRYCN